MAYEVEQKFHVDKFSDLRQALQELESNPGSAVWQSDIYFSPPGHDFRKTDEALRLRDDGVGKFITYKGPRVDSTTKTRRELELTMPGDPEFWSQFQELLQLLGFAVIARVKKQRQTSKVIWEGVSIEIAFDEVEHLGMFVELEIMADDINLDIGRQRIVSLAKRLGLTRNETRSYCQLILER